MFFLYVLAFSLLSAAPLEASDQSQPSPARTEDPVDGFLKEDERLEKDARYPPALREDLGSAADRVREAPADTRPQAVRTELPLLVPRLLEPAMEAVPAAERNRTVNEFARISQRLGNDQDAVTLAEDVLRRDPDNERAYTVRALAYYDLENYPAALEDAKRALAINPNNGAAFQILKLAQNRVGSPEELGLNAAQKALADKVKRDYQDWEQQRNRLESGRGRAPARPEAAGSPAQAARFRELLAGARAKINMGRYRPALQALDLALRLDPGNAEAFYLRAAAQSMLGLHAEAAADAGEALRRDPSHLRALDARASAMNALGRHAEARADAERALKLDPEDGYAYRNRAIAKEKRGDFKGMLEDWRLAASFEPQFEPEYREAAARHNVAPARESFSARAVPEAPRAEGAAREPAPPPRSRLKARLVVTVSGGLLLAAGLTHILWPLRRSRGRGRPAGGPRLQAGYKLLRILGQGGMGVVYEAYDRALGRRVAIKRLLESVRKDERERRRFLQEARIVAALHHPGIVDIHTILEEGEELYLVFEFVEGETVEELLRRRKRLPLEEARAIVSEVLGALDFAHRRSVIHRDLKPSNIMLGQEGRVKVMDFGIARLAKDAQSHLTATATVVGTPLYMAPEAEQGMVRPESDLYSLGACLYEMTTGRRPFPGPGGAAKLSKDYPKPSQLVPGLPPGLDALIDAALEPDPERRVRSAAEFRSRLDAVPRPSQV